MRYELKIKNLKLKIGLLAILMSLFLNLKSAPLASAQTVDIGINPAIFEMNATSPSSIEAPFTIENFTDNAIDLKISLKPFTASPDENGQVAFLDDTSQMPDPTLLEKVKITQNGQPIDSITLSPKQKKDLKIIIDLPTNEPKGDYYFSVIFSSNPQSDINSTSTLASAGVASNVLLTVGPTGPASGIIQTFSSPFLMFNGPVPFTVALKNTSNHFVTIKGDIIIKNLFGQAIGKVTLLPVNILSNTVRRIPDSLQILDPSDKKYLTIKNTVDANQFPVAVWPEKFLFGPYTADLTLTMSAQGPVYKRKLVFFAFPLEYLIFSLIVLGIIVYIAIRVRQKVNEKL